MMTVLLFKRVGTQVSAFKLGYYGNHEICMQGVYLIIYVYILEQLPEHCIF